MRELSLFTGAGGGLLASHLLGWRPVGYVEWEDYCQRVIAQRIADGCIPAAPIFGDIRAFVRDGYAASYTGLVDVVSGGFPCQPFSMAGARLGEDDAQNMWPAVADCIRVVRPRFAYLENVSGLLTSGYFGRILGDLSACGYDCRWRVLSAAELGAPHKRDRLWIVCNANGNSQPACAKHDGSPRLPGDAANADGAQRKKVQCAERAKPEHANASGAGWWDTEPCVGRVADGVAHRMDRLKAIGNGQVPAVAAAAWEFLTA